MNHASHSSAGDLVAASVPLSAPTQARWDAAVFKGNGGLRGLLEADAFWDQQPYETRLYYGAGVTEYLQRGVLRAAVEFLERPLASMLSEGAAMITGQLPEESRDAQTFAQAVGGAPAVIGYSEQSQAAFRHGWTAALDRVYELECAAIRDSILAELGMRFAE